MLLTSPGARVALFPTMYARAVRETRRIIVVVTAVPLLIPIFWLTIFASVFSGLVGAGGFGPVTNYTLYAAPGAILMAVMLSATAAVSVAVERQTGFYDRMRISPRGPRTSNLARRVADGTKLFFFALVLVVVSWLAGAGTEHWPLVLLLGTVLPTLWGFGYTGIAFAACLRTARPEVSEAILPLFFPLLFVSSAFVPISQLPGWMQPIATYNPLTYLCDAIRSAYLGTIDVRALVVSAASIVVLIALTQLLISWAERAVSRDD